MYVTLCSLWTLFKDKMFISLPYNHTVFLQIALLGINCLQEHCSSGPGSSFNTDIFSSFSLENLSTMDWLSSSIHPFGLTDSSWIEHMTSCFRNSNCHHLQTILDLLCHYTALVLSLVFSLVVKRQFHHWHQKNDCTYYHASFQRSSYYR